MSKVVAGSRLAKEARFAERDDIAERLEGLDEVVVTEACRYHAMTGVRVSVWTEFVVSRWDLPDGPVWHLSRAAGGLFGGEGEAWEDVVVTEYVLADERVREAVLAVVDAPVDPWRFTSDWSREFAPRRTYSDGTPSDLRDRLAQGMHAWVDAVTALRKLDDRQAPPPMMAQREL